MGADNPLHPTWKRYFFPIFESTPPHLKNFSLAIGFPSHKFRGYLTSSQSCGTGRACSSRAPAPKLAGFAFPESKSIVLARQWHSLLSDLILLQNLLLGTGYEGSIWNWKTDFFMAGSCDSSEEPQTGSKETQWNVINYDYLLLDSFVMWAGIIYSFP